MGHLTQCVLLKNDIEPYAQKCYLYTANAVVYVIAEWEARQIIVPQLTSR